MKAWIIPMVYAAATHSRLHVNDIYWKLGKLPDTPLPKTFVLFF
jgi:hypothetical protein